MAAGSRNLQEVVSVSVLSLLLVSNCYVLAAVREIHTNILRVSLANIANVGDRHASNLYKKHVQEHQI